MSSKLLKSVTKIGFGIAILGGVSYSVLYNVASGHRAIIFDRFQGVKPEVIGEGIHFKIPWLQKPIIFDIRIKSSSVSVTISSRDLQTVNISLHTLYRPREDVLPKIFMNLGYDYDKIVLPSIINEVLKAVIAQFDASELISQRTLVSQQITKLLTDRANQFGVILDDISITNLTFGQELKS